MESQILKVTLWGEEVGKVKWDHLRKCGVFTYHPEFVKKGIDIAPLTASIRKGYGKGENVTGVPMRRANKFTGLPVFLADSLPDAWGKRLTTVWNNEFGVESRKLTPLDYLAYMGKRGMGALEFEPDHSPWNQTDNIQLDKLTLLAQKIFNQKEEISLSPGDEWDMAALCSVGTSAGGMQPKAVLAIHNETGEIRSGQIIHSGNWNYYILKFAKSNEEQACEMEMGYYLMAKAAGIDMMPSRLIEVSGQKHFLTERFDRKNGNKIHLQTLGAMAPNAESYEEILEICDKLRLPYPEKEEMFRRMVFNILAGCTDDHNRNFSFMMRSDGKWNITPAYDLTFTIDFNDLAQSEDHLLSVRGKYSEISEKDLLLFAKENDIKNASSIIRKVSLAVSDAERFLKEGGVHPTMAKKIGEYLNRNCNLSSRKP